MKVKVGEGQAVIGTEDNWETAFFVKLVNAPSELEHAVWEFRQLGDGNQPPLKAGEHYKVDKISIYAAKWGNA